MYGVSNDDARAKAILRACRAFVACITGSGVVAPVAAMERERWPQAMPIVRVAQKPCPGGRRRGDHGFDSGLGQFRLKTSGHVPFAALRSWVCLTGTLQGVAFREGAKSG